MSPLVHQFAEFLHDLQQLERAALPSHGALIFDAFNKHTPFDVGAVYMRDGRGAGMRLAAKSSQCVAPEILDLENPDGDLPLTYAWSFGDGATATGVGSMVSHTYTTAGTHNAKVTVTDARGAVGSSTLPIKVDATAPPTCLTGRSDGFDGTSLNTGRWSSR